ncbi:MAG TPA: HAD family hydrolase [Casimicrobiaceae bacterium]|nr:HAD family hydrolase [Casimicrobiaceae bacterium]
MYCRFHRSPDLRFLALAADYDGTIAGDGVVDDATVAALARLKQTGRRLILVSGRQRADLAHVFPALDIFDLAVVENGALLYNPATREEHALAPRPSAALVDALRARNVSPLSVGVCIVATQQACEATVREVIRELGLDLAIAFNKGALMMLPAGVDKASGLHAAIDALGLRPNSVLGIGDAENDLPFLRVCGCSAAVGNALPMVRKEVDVWLAQENGAGVVKLIDRLLRDEAALVSSGRDA